MRVKKLEDWTASQILVRRLMSTHFGVMWENFRTIWKDTFQSPRAFGPSSGIAKKHLSILLHFWGLFRALLKNTYQSSFTFEASLGIPEIHFSVHLRFSRPFEQSWNTLFSPLGQYYNNFYIIFLKRKASDNDMEFASWNFTFFRTSAVAATWSLQFNWLCISHSKTKSDTSPFWSFVSAPEKKIGKRDVKWIH